MNLWKSCGLFLVLVLSSAVAHAQFSVYGEYSVNRLGQIKCLDPMLYCSSNQSNAEGGVVNPSQNDSVNLEGGFGGVSYDWKKFGPALIGFDLRAGEGHSNKSAVSGAGGENATGYQGVLGGVKASFHTPIKILKPYAQFSMGWARSDATEPFGTTEVLPTSPVPPRVYDHYIQYEGFVGLDVKIVSFLDLRLPELGIGEMGRLGSSSGTGTNSFGVKTVALGIVLHLP
jgi:hypothetical protein